MKITSTTVVRFAMGISIFILAHLAITNQLTAGHSRGLLLSLFLLYMGQREHKMEQG